MPKWSYWMPSTKVEICVAMMRWNSPHRPQTIQILFRMIPPLCTQQQEPSAFQFTSCLAFFYNRNRYFWFSKCDSSVLLQSSPSKYVCVSRYLSPIQPPSLTHTILSSRCWNNLFQRFLLKRHKFPNSWLLSWLLIDSTAPLWIIQGN